MKIGIVTIFDCVNNSGAFLQAYALKLYLEKQGHTVYHIVKNKNDRFVNLRIKKEIKNYCPSGGFAIKIVKKIIRSSQIIFDYKRKEFICRNDFKNMNTVTVDKANKLNLDLVICGSDEIWNLNNPDVGDEFYFAKNVKAKRKISYAVSCGVATAQQFEDAGYPAQEILRFDRLLVRDGQTQSVVKKLTKITPEKVCDPTFLVDTKLLSKPTKRPVREKYMLVYTYGLCLNIRKHIIRYAKEKELALVSAIIEQSFTDKYIFISPMKFADIIRNAECVYTSTLHGSIFTTLLHKSAVFSAPFPKVKDILTNLKQADKIAEDDISYEDFVKIIESPVNIDDITSSHQNLKANGMNELNKILGEIENEIY